jgi:hypothetical protein
MVWWRRHQREREPFSLLTSHIGSLSFFPFFVFYLTTVDFSLGILYRAFFYPPPTLYQWFSKHGIWNRSIKIP